MCEDVWVCEDLWVCEDVWVCGSVWVCEDVWVYEDVWVCGSVCHWAEVDCGVYDKLTTHLEPNMLSSCADYLFTLHSATVGGPC